MTGAEGGSPPLRDYQKLGLWCGDWSVDLQTWQCPDCARPVPDGTRKRLTGAPTRAPEGMVWVLTSKPQEGWGGDEERTWAGGVVVGVYLDRAHIARWLVRDRHDDAAGIRERIAEIHWYQGFYNPDLIEGWAEGGYEPRSYKIGLERVHGWRTP